ncbi:hypothetical protein TWF481_008378 [Arthrobotrys musiformis]|uniref:Uncharacterized protein n=1 Tax=Arthrobotrys musiformis TaxID=47236 RepID=A0AAV9W8S7_9PEZI
MAGWCTSPSGGLNGSATTTTIVTVTVSAATTSAPISAATVFQTVTVTVTPTKTVYYSHLEWCTNIAPQNIFDREVVVGADQAGWATNAHPPKPVDLGPRCLVPRVLGGVAAAIGLLLLVWDWWRMRGVVGRSEALEVHYKFYASMHPGAEHRDHVLVSDKLYEMLRLGIEET